MNRGKFIVFYGINRIGKSKQTELLVDRLRSHKIKAEFMKYAVYDLEPTGPIINQYLRMVNDVKNPYNLSPREFQLMQAMNRYQYEPRLKHKLEHRINVVSEDYIGTSLAWGIANGVDGRLLDEVNSGLIKEDKAFLFDGNQFSSGKEHGHMHESNYILTEGAKLAHQVLAERYGWIKINPNLSEEKVHEQIWQHVKPMYQGKLKFYLGMPIASKNGMNEQEGMLIAERLMKHGTILDSHVIDPEVYEKESSNEAKGINIYERDMAWLMDADLAVFEATVPSTEIGREIERARLSGIPTLVLFNGNKQKRPTRMVLHDKLVKHKIYTTGSSLVDAIEEFIEQNPCYIHD